MFPSFNLDKIYQFLIIALAFLLPLTVFGANLVIVVICTLWLISGEYKSKFSQIFKNKLMLASIIFFCIHFVGLLWTEDLSWGLHIVHKMWYFIGLWPILYTLVRNNYIKHYIFAFLIAMFFSVICSYLIWFELIDSLESSMIQQLEAKFGIIINQFSVTPFMSSVSYNPILAFAIYLVLYEIIFNKNNSRLKTYCYSFFSIIMIINIFITNGRAGQIGFFVMIVLLVFQFFKNQNIKAFIVTLIIIPTIFFSSYQIIDNFKIRVNSAIDNVYSFSENKKNTSVGIRLSYLLNSLQIIKQNAIIGVGTGDFPTEYRKINQINTPSLPNSTNPHSMFTLVLVQLGLIGFFSMLSIFYYQIKFSYNSSSTLIRNAGTALPVLFFVVMFSDSYLLGHFTSLMFIFFSSFLYKDFENS